MTAAHLARPYARAVFELAQQQQQLAAWNAQLILLAQIAAAAEVVRIAKHPKVSGAQLQELILAAAGDNLESAAVNLVKLLIHNNRVLILPQIAAAFAQLRAEAERVISAEVTTAVEIDEAQRARFVEALSKKFGCEVTLECKVDAGLIGGAVIRAGDTVLDASTRSELAQLRAAIAA